LTGSPLPKMVSCSMVCAPDILLVEDNDIVAECLCEVLALDGYTVLYARGADEGWRFFREHHPHSVITDNVMNGDRLSDLSGLGLATQVKGASPTTPVIMLSAIPPQEAADVCDTVLCKPVTARVIAETLARLGVHPSRR
jgi:DNA-binding response OmpR family regulator